ncbi:hypothetical protein ARMGADRAFT_814366 [Armillaria gallica]|uniref:F-box domain-containing protein n=1 Tax=Armillaria gallica TaxID=47427 RepID=A0A2H3CPK9_ARMGA|nr:hypothetical protein ARMGADRAFT_814366 [Armillaria gallica]
MPDMALFQILTSRKFENLETLVISYSWNSWESETALLNALHSLYPRPLHLEFNRYGTEPKADALDVMLPLQHALSRCVHLKTLRLNLEKAPAELSFFRSHSANDRSARRFKSLYRNQTHLALGYVAN